MLRESLAEFSRWVRGKLEGMEENMDIFRVIYSLHRSLSQVSNLQYTVSIQSSIHTGAVGVAGDAKETETGRTKGFAAGQEQQVINLS